MTAAPSKPRRGEPCNGCGLCCIVEPCMIATDVMGWDRRGPCPALEFDDGRYWCGMVRNPARYTAEHFPPGDWPAINALIGRMVERALGIDCGCDAEDELPVVVEHRWVGDDHPRA